MTNYKLTLEYDGTNYHGYQTQKAGIITIQGCLEEVLSQLAKTRIKVIGGGRTDAGVHARNQVINFFSDLSVPLDRLPLAVNRLLPPDIRVKTAQQVDNKFHACYSAISKTYVYYLRFAPIESVFHRNYCWWLKKEPLWDRVLTEGKNLEGTRDFAAFTASGSTVKSTVRTLTDFTLETKNDMAKLSFTANGFLYYMVRNMVGTLVELGLGQRTMKSVEEILASKDRNLAGITAPARGLFLENIRY